ncbi:hypothetical protein Pse7367_0640 [Thalassoporum mexicanum PCC 7367]|uniref:SMI1/KNR4 family protein n=1 Tax=Thalassoporum mexicanum TaxID=3457544 RepID=UPI00029FC403|nr:SMI1/KNR4 family protein [Pseudanabaena sp. PCC 7367]AFY68943.1 hypothetical protein Pse7367_0640 [Pseudanabaena sp. PCC 7367]
MSELTDALERIENWLVANAPKIAEGFEPGISREEIDRLLAKYKFIHQFPEELYEFYGWHNGAKYSVVPYYSNFFSLERALHPWSSWGFHKVQEHEEIEEDEPDIWNWKSQHLRIMDLEGDEVCAVDVVAPRCPIWRIDIESDKILYNSLTSYMQAYAECYEAGGYSYDSEEGLWEEDKEIVESIQLKYGCTDIDFESLSAEIDVDFQLQMLEQYTSLLPGMAPRLEGMRQELEKMKLERDPASDD